MLRVVAQPSCRSHTLRSNVGPGRVSISLLQLSTSELVAVASSRVPAGLEDRIGQGSLPPPFVAVRALELAAAGHPPPWATTFLIVRDEDGRIVGGCGFKAAPVDGRVEVGYGVARAAQGRGSATAALTMLVRIAFDAGATEVLAEVAPTNPASTRVVRKAGFEQIGTRTDHENELLAQWVRRSEAWPSRDAARSPQISTRVASCSCGQLTATASGEPVRVSVCHCLACQRRTGSVFGAQARFNDGQVSVSGRSTEYVRVGDEGSRVRFRFCPDCGATVYYTIDDWAGVVAIPVGAFAEPDFPEPAFSVYEERMHKWVGLPDGIEHMA